MFSLTRYCFYSIVAANFLYLCGAYQSNVQDLLTDAIRKNNSKFVIELLTHEKPEYSTVSALKADSKGVLPMQAAIDGRNKVITGLLLKHGADLKAKVKSCKNACNLFLYAVGTNCLELVDQFLSSQPSLLDSVDDNKDNGLHLSAINNLTDMAHKLIMLETDVDSIDSAGKTALHYACRSASLSIVSDLVFNGNAQVDIKDNDGRIPGYYVPSKSTFYKDICDVLNDAGGEKKKENAFQEHDRKLLQLDSEERMIDDNFKLSEDKRTWLIGSLAETFGTKKKNISNFLYSNYCRNVKLYE